MKVLIIPDVHLKPWIFDRAVSVMENEECERAVCLGDIVDDWGCQHDVELYEKTLKSVIDFAERYPDTLWCYGNHDLSYLWEQHDHPGFSDDAQDIVCSYFNSLEDMVGQSGGLAIIHRIDNVLFSHAGLYRGFVEYWLKNVSDDIDDIIYAVNNLGDDVLWDVESPIWIRPQYSFINKEDYYSDYLQVVGHTPMRHALLQGNVLSTDTFSTRPDGSSLGEEELCWVDTTTKQWGYVD